MINSGEDTDTAEFLYLAGIRGYVLIQRFGNHTTKLREKCHSAVTCRSVIRGIFEYLFVTMLNDISAGTYCIGGWVGQRSGLEGCGKPCPHRDSIPGPSSP